MSSRGRSLRQRKEQRTALGLECAWQAWRTRRPVLLDQREGRGEYEDMKWEK